MMLKYGFTPVLTHLTLGRDRWTKFEEAMREVYAEIKDIEIK